MLRIIKNEWTGALKFQFIFFTSQEIEILTDILKRYYGDISTLPTYTYLDLSQILTTLKMDMLEGVVYVDNQRIEENLQRLYGGKNNG